MLTSQAPISNTEQPVAPPQGAYVLPPAAKAIIAEKNWPRPNSHTEWMAMAIALAELGRYSTSPNPMVGCLLVRDGKLIGAGYHQKAGYGHAEVNALAHAADNGQSVKGCTVYVTLEPCSHHGRTGPCCDRLIEADVKKVVFAGQDPNPQVSGRGLGRLQAAGVEVIGPVLESTAHQLNRAFFHRMRTGRPWVRAKMAMSLDGRTAMSDGSSQWITGSAARVDVQRLRAESCAIITGHQTISLDGAKLNVREQSFCSALTQQLRQPLRVALDSTLTLTGNEPFFHTDGDKWWVHCADETVNTLSPNLTQGPNNTQQKLLPANHLGKIDLAALIEQLADAQCNQVLVEAGATLTGAFLEQGLLNELVVYMAPTLMGSSARPLFSLPLENMTDKVPLMIQEVRQVGQDWRITALTSDQ